ncbi:MAG: type I phosphomannose isomerase catalytic subunit [Anaerolineae bacterium]
MAESWEISGHEKGSTSVVGGVWDGQSLPDVLGALGERLVGSNARAYAQRGRFPLLVKLLDAHRDLSVQVHPDDAYAAAHENGDTGKTEMWYVLYADPGTELIYGLAPGVTPASFREALRRDAIETQLHRVPIARGDVFYIPAGTVHALLAGAVVAEIQQSSDATYRLYDWGRLGADGKPRPLHVSKAMDVINWDMIAPTAIQPSLIERVDGVQRWLLADDPRVTVEKLDLATGATWEGVCDGSTFEVIGCVEGAVCLTWVGAPQDLASISWRLLPAVLGSYAIHSDADSVVLRAYVQESAPNAR